MQRNARSVSDVEIVYLVWSSYDCALIIEGLYLKAFDPQKIKINRKVQQFYTSINK